MGYDEVMVEASSVTLHIVLQEDTKTLEEVVVVGYGTRRKETLTGAVSAVTASEIVVTKNENVVNMLSGSSRGYAFRREARSPANSITRSIFVAWDHPDRGGRGTP